MGKNFAKRSTALGRALFYALMAAGTAMMLSASGSYLELGDAHPFFLEKLPLARPTWWLAALYVHVPSALLALPACLVLTSGWVRKRWPRFHRWLGRATGVLVLIAVVPPGMYLALFAQGGMITTLGFWLTGAITWLAMVMSVCSARGGDFKAHRRWSGHVVAQLSVAVVSRLLLMCAELLDVYGEWAYIASLWGPVLGCALVAELATGTRPFRIAKGTSRHETLVAVARLDAVR